MLRVVAFVAVQVVLFGSLLWPALARDVSAPSAQTTPVLTYTFYLPVVYRSQPVNSMTWLTLRPDDVPPGFSLNQESVITDFSEIQIYNPVEGYQASYINFGQLFSGIFVIASSATLFDSSLNAQKYLQFIQKFSLELTGTSSIPIPPLGEEEMAFQIISPDTPSGVVNLIFVRDQNIVINVATAGFYPVASNFNDTLSLTRIVVSRF